MKVRVIVFITKRLVTLRVNAAEFPGGSASSLLHLLWHVTFSGQRYVLKNISYQCLAACTYRSQPHHFFLLLSRNFFLEREEPSGEDKTPNPKKSGIKRTETSPIIIHTHPNKKLTLTLCLKDQNPHTHILFSNSLICRTNSHQPSSFLFKFCSGVSCLIFNFFTLWGYWISLYIFGVQDIVFLNFLAFLGVF